MFDKIRKNVLSFRMTGIIFYFIVTAGASLGCAKQEIWPERFIPNTAEERKAVAEMTEKILSATPRELSGHDQDWDDAIREANEAACRTICRPTYWERNDYIFTGKWRYAEE